MSVSAIYVRHVTVCEIFCKKLSPTQFGAETKCTLNMYERFAQTILCFLLPEKFFFLF